MDNGTLIAGAVFIALCIIPIVYMYRNVRNREAQMVKHIENLAAESGCRISSKDVSGDLAIGLDEDAGMLFIARKSKKEMELSAISLEGLRACNVHRLEHNIVDGVTPRSILDRLDLNLTTKNGERRTVCIFDSSDRAQLYDEWNLIKKWEDRISRYLPESIGI
jgi:hypothetical protein